MLRLKAGELFPRAKNRFFGRRKTSLLNKLIAQLASDNHSLFLVTQDFIFGIGIHRDREVCRQCPWRGCPDRDVYRSISWQTDFRHLAGRKWKSHVDRGVVALLVFHLSFG